MRAAGWIAAKAAIITLAVVDVVASWWLNDVLTTRRPGSPQGAYTVPFETHGGTTYLSSVDHAWRIVLIGVGVAVVLAWWIVGHFEKRSRIR